MDIIGSDGRIRITESGHKIERFVVGESSFYSGYDSLQYQDSWDGEPSDTLLVAVRDLVGCVTNGGVPLCSGDDAIAALAIGIGAIESARSGTQMLLDTGLNELR